MYAFLVTVFAELYLLEMISSMKTVKSSQHQSKKEENDGWLDSLNLNMVYKCRLSCVSMSTE